MRVVPLSVVVAVIVCAGPVLVKTEVRVSQIVLVSKIVVGACQVLDQRGSTAKGAERAAEG